MTISAMFKIDGSLLAALAFLLVAVCQYCYQHANFYTRAALYGAAIVSFFCALHIFGLVPLSVTRAYWARVVLDGFLVAACVARLIWGRFVPASPARSSRAGG